MAPNPVTLIEESTEAYQPWQGVGWYWHDPDDYSRVQGPYETAELAWGEFRAYLEIMRT